MWSVNGHVAGENLIWAALGLLVAIIYLPRAVRAFQSGEWRTAKAEHRDTLMLISGIGLVALGGVLHRIFWTVWRWLDKPEWMTEVSLFVTTPSVLLIAAGYGLHITVAHGRTRLVLIGLGTLVFGMYAIGLWAA